MPPKTTNAPRSRDLASELVAAQRIAGVDADADDVARLHALQIERLERLVDDLRRAVAFRRRRREDVQPARRDDRRAERQVARIDEMDAHAR